MTGRNEDTDIERGASAAPRGNPDHDSDIREERPEDPAEEPVQEPPD